MHDGAVRAHSDGQGRGTQVSVRLPVLETERDVVAARLRCLPRLSPPRRDGFWSWTTTPTPPRRSRCSCACPATTVETAFDGLEALRVAPGFLPDIVLLDIGMPRMDGYDTARSMRAEPWGKHLVLVALTGWGQPKDRDLTMQAGFNAHLVKPVATDDLVRVLDRESGHSGVILRGFFRKASADRIHHEGVRGPVPRACRGGIQICDERRGQARHRRGFDVGGVSGAVSQPGLDRSRPGCLAGC